MKFPRRSLFALPILGLVDAAFATEAKPLALVMNSGESSVSVIDMASRKVVKNLPTLREPSHWALTPDRSKLYIADASGNALFIVDPISAAPLGHKLIADPYQLAYTPDQKYLVVNALRINRVDIYDGASLEFVQRFTAGRMPSHLDFSPDSQWSFNSMQGSNTLVSIDLNKLEVRWRAQVGPAPAGVLWLNGKILVCIMGADHVAEIDPQTGIVLRRIKTGIGPHNLFLTEDGSTLYVSNRIGGSLTALDPVSMSIKRTYTLPGGPDDLGIDPQGNLWVALRFANQIAVLDPVSGKTSSIDVGLSPHGIFLNTDLQKPGKLTAETL